MSLPKYARGKSPAQPFTWAHIHLFFMPGGQPSYKWEYFIETLWQFIKRALNQVHIDLLLMYFPWRIFGLSLLTIRLISRRLNI
jgi:hypothetical protein